MQLNRENLEIIFNYIESQLEDDDGRGEFDEETSILSAVDRTIDMFEDDKELKKELENRELKNALLNEAEKRGFNKDHLDKHLEVIIIK